MGVIRFWSDDTASARDIFLIRRDYAAAVPTGRIQVLVPAPDELWNAWAPWGSWRTADDHDEALAVICEELDNLPAKIVDPIVWTLHDAGVVVARLVATNLDDPVLGGRLEPADRFEAWAPIFAVGARLVDVPGLTMADHNGVRVSSYGIRVHPDHVYWFPADQAGRPARHRP